MKQMIDDFMTLSSPEESKENMDTVSLRFNRNTKALYRDL